MDYFVIIRIIENINSINCQLRILMSSLTLYIICNYKHRGEWQRKTRRQQLHHQRQAIIAWVSTNLGDRLGTSQQCEKWNGTKPPPGMPVCLTQQPWDLARIQWTNHSLIRNLKKMITETNTRRNNSQKQHKYRPLAIVPGHELDGPVQWTPYAP